MLGRTSRLLKSVPLLCQLLLIGGCTGYGPVAAVLAVGASATRATYKPPPHPVLEDDPSYESLPDSLFWHWHDRLSGAHYIVNGLSLDRVSAEWKLYQGRNPKAPAAQYFESIGMSCVAGRLNIRCERTIRAYYYCFRWQESSAFGGRRAGRLLVELLLVPYPVGLTSTLTTTEGGSPCPAS